MKYVVVVSYGIDGAKQEHRRMCSSLEDLKIEFESNLRYLTIKTDKQQINYISHTQNRQFAMGRIIDEVVFKVDEFVVLAENKALYIELLMRVLRQVNTIPAAFSYAGSLIEKSE